MNSIAVILISTGSRYKSYIAPSIESLKKFFPPHDTFLFTDSEESFDAIKIPQVNLGWPKASLMRFHIMLAEEKRFSGYEHVFYIDVDMQATRKIEEQEICSNGLTAVIHPGFPRTFERREKSKAYIQGNPPYYQACFFGGKREAFFEMCSTISANIDEDTKNGITAVWYDESYLNQYLNQCQPLIALSPLWAWPEKVVLNNANNDSYLNKLKGWKGWDKKDTTPVILHREKPRKILIAVESCVRDLRNGSHQTVRETWGKDLFGVDLRFFIGGKESLKLQADETQLDVEDDYAHLPEKTKEIFRWAGVEGYDFTFKCDVDTFLIPSRLLVCGFENHDYTGFFTHHSAISYRYASGGYGYFLSRRAADLIVSSATNTTHPYLRNEDLWVGQVLGPKIQTENHPEREFSMYEPTKFRDYASWHINTNRKGPEANQRWMRENYMSTKVDDNAIVRGVWFGSELTNIQKLCIRSYINNGHEFHLYVSGPVAGIPVGTIVEDAEKVISHGTLQQARARFCCITHFSDYFRALLILKEGGWYVDLDTVCLKHFDFPEPYAFVSESTIYGTAKPGDKPTPASTKVEEYLSGCIFKAPANDPFVQYVVNRIESMNNSNPAGCRKWILTGPALFKEVIPMFGLQQYVKAPSVFDGVNYSEFSIFVTGGADWSFLEKSYAIHLRTSAWKGGDNGLEANRTYSLDSLFEQLKRKHGIGGESKNPKVSIIIPLYNKEEFVAQAIKSAITQTYNNFEVIVVNDGSTDRSLAIAQAYADKITIINQENKGLSEALNTGMKASTGDFLLPFDSDDWIEPDYIAKTVPLMADKKVGVVSTDVQLEGLRRELLRVPETTLEQEMVSNRLPSCSLIRREAFFQTPMYVTESEFQDWNLWLDILKRGWTIAYVHEPLSHYRTQQTSMLSRLAPRRDEIYAKIQQLHPDLPWDKIKSGITPVKKQVIVAPSPVSQFIGCWDARHDPTKRGK